MKALLVEQDYIDASKLLNCEVSAIKAVTQVESGGYGFLPDDRPKISFEAHYFHNLTGGKYDVSHPNISSPIWDRKLYKGGALEYTRLAEAQKLDSTCALESASWGMFQIMGGNFHSCGFNTVQDFVTAMQKDSRSHLMAFCHSFNHK